MRMIGGTKSCYDTCPLYNPSCLTGFYYSSPRSVPTFLHIFVQCLCVQAGGWQVNGFDYYSSYPWRLEEWAEINMME